MLQLNPSESFPIIRILVDNQDSNTYYVQAVVRDAVTDAILSTVNLANVGTRRFRTMWKVPYDNVYNTGRHIVITTTVYTDSGYTTRSENYYDEVQQYIIAQRWNPSLISVAGTNPEPTTPAGMSEEDHSKLEKLIRKVLEEEKKPDKPVDVRPLHNSIIAISKQINAIKIPEAKEPDMSGVENSIRAMVREIRSYEANQASEIMPIVKKLEELMNMHSMVMDSVVVPLQKENLRLRTLLAAVSPDFAEQALERKKKARLDALMAKYNQK